MLVDVIGYLASLIILISFMISDNLKLRIVNSIGSLLFLIYAIIKLDYPIICINSSIILINIYFILKIKKTITKI